MAKQKKTNFKSKPIGKKPEAKKPLINPRYKNTIWTVVLVVVLTVFFIVNNTKSVQERGPYPPNYTLNTTTIQTDFIDSRISFIIPNIETDGTND